MTPDEIKAALDDFSPAELTAMYALASDIYGAAEAASVAHCSMGVLFARMDRLDEIAKEMLRLEKETAPVAREKKG